MLLRICKQDVNESSKDGCELATPPIQKLQQLWTYTVGVCRLPRPRRNSTDALQLQPGKRFISRHTPGTRSPPETPFSKLVRQSKKHRDIKATNYWPFGVSLTPIMFSYPNSSPLPALVLHAASNHFPPILNASLIVRFNKNACHDCRLRVMWRFSMGL